MNGTTRVGLGTLVTSIVMGIFLPHGVGAYSRAGISNPEPVTPPQLEILEPSTLPTPLASPRLRPMWLHQGTPNGTGVGTWPENFMEEEEDGRDTWIPPDWSDDFGSSSLWILNGIDGQPAEESELSIWSKSAFVYDLDSEEVLLSYGGDNRLPVASITKLLTGLTVTSEQVDLNQPICLDGAIHPSWPGARTRLDEDLCTRGWDLLGAAMVRSDNGAAIALADLTDLPFRPFVHRMNEVARDLGMSNSSFTDPTGVEDTNLSTARDVTRLVVAAALDPEVSTAASSPWWDVQFSDGRHFGRFFSTHPLHGDDAFEILAAKTGYTDTALHCFAAVLQLRDGRRVAVTTLGARRSQHRWRDVDRILSWLQRAY